ncbi:MAG: hypothetical protein ACR2PL_24265 [Dehalococcoidia bacterium]
MRAVYEELTGIPNLRYVPMSARCVDHVRGALALRLDRIGEARNPPIPVFKAWDGSDNSRSCHPSARERW